MGFVMSPSFVLMALAMASSIVGAAHDGSRVLPIVFVCMSVGIFLSSFLVAKVENSEWRQELRRKAQEREAALGITEEAKREAARNMNLPDSLGASAATPASKKDK